MRLERFAPAKVNLFLHVGPAAADGYHPICSLMVFADVGDRVTLSSGVATTFGLEGPFAGALNSESNNLVLRARDGMIAAVDGPWPAFRLTLDKQLPIAAGLGGGSADAAATLAVLDDWARSLGLRAPDPERLAAIAATLGADVAACRSARSVIAEGRGDRLTAAPAMPRLDAVLVNPGPPSSTAAVYRAFDMAGAAARSDRPVLPKTLASPETVAAFLGGCRNDLEAPAIALEPLIGDVLAKLRAQAESLIARMSGSGATCFSLCAGETEATRMAEKLANDHPAWWVRRCKLGDGANDPAN